MTKKELMEIIQDLPDETEIVTSSRNFEKNGEYVKARACIEYYKKEEKVFWDSFDGTRYTSDVYVADDTESNPVIVVWG